MKEEFYSFLFLMVVGIVLLVAMSFLPTEPTLWFAAFIWSVAMASLLARMIGGISTDLTKDDA